MQKTTTQPTPETLNRWMITPELMAYLKVSKSTVDRLKREKRIPYSKIMGICRFDRFEIDKWLEDATIKAGV